MKKLITYLHNFFFEEVSASGFGLMRIAWAATVLTFLLGGSADIIRYYSEAGLLPADLGHLVFRNEYRFTLLETITSPNAVIVLWSTFVVTLTCMLIGLWPRLMTVTSVLLLFSFHERNLQPLGGGDTVLRTIGFILMIAPELSAFSIDRLEAQWKHWKTTNTFLPALKTNIWPYRLLLWQIIIIYITSAIDKLNGTMWLDGTVVEAVFHHTHFTRWPMETMNAFVWISPLASFYTIIFEYAWLLLLVPRELWRVLPGRIRKHSFKRWLIASGLLFHWGIFVFMDVGAFPFAMTTAFIGLLLDQDFAALKRLGNTFFSSNITVLYDGVCILCRRSIFTVKLLDHLGRIHAVDFRDTAKKNAVAKELKEADLDRAMHIKMPSGRYYQGFDAFRVLTWHLPATKLLTPLLYVPGVAPVGRFIYENIAENRNKCANGACVHKS